ncbi:MAG: O-antigen ligase family protein [Ruminococcaceae bacterium]|nr:O-antigen ligase family protein [Oscillospiraceae bacterium]
MGYGAVLRDRCPAIKWLVNAQKTVWYPILFAVLCIISGSSNHTVYLPIIYILCSFVIFSVLFTDDNKVFLVPMLMIYYSLGMDNTDANPGGVTGDSLLSSFKLGAFEKIIACGVVVVVIFAIRLIADGSLSTGFKQNKLGAIGIFALDIAFLLNGLLNPDYPTTTLLYGAILAISFTFFYLSCSCMLHDSKDFIPYACKAMVCTAYVALFQFLIKAWRLHASGDLFFFNAQMEIDRLDREALSLAWGLPTMIAAVFVLGVPAAMYLARNCKFSPISYFSASAFVIGTILINTRSAMIVGSVVFIFCLVICCFNNKDHPRNPIYGRIFFAILIFTSIYMLSTIPNISGVIEKVLHFLRLEDYDNNARIVLWEKGMEDFSNFPIFGAGFDTGSNIKNNVFSSMYHCILIQLLGSTGIVGALAFLIHVVTVGIIFFKKFSINKLILLLIPLMIVGMSLVDNFYFYPNFQIFYCVFIVLAESCTFPYKDEVGVSAVNNETKPERSSAAQSQEQNGIDTV